MGILGYLLKLKRDLGLAFGSLFNTLSMDKFQCHIFFPSQDIKQNLSSSYLDN